MIGGKPVHFIHPGEPKVPWGTGFVDGLQPPSNPKQLRPTDVKGALIGQAKRTEGLDPPFSIAKKTTTSFHLHKEEATETLKFNGNFIITFYPDPASKRVVSILVHHSKFTLAVIRIDIKEHTKPWDSFDCHCC